MKLMPSSDNNQINSISDLLANPAKLEQFKGMSPEAQDIVLTKLKPDYENYSKAGQLLIKNRLYRMVPSQPQPMSTKQGIVDVAKDAVNQIPFVQVMKGGGEAPSKLGGAVGVGLERLKTAPGKTFLDKGSVALNRANEALKPDFKPQEGEKIGYYGGQIAGSLALPTGAVGKEAATASSMLKEAKAGYNALDAASGIKVEEVAEKLATASKQDLVNIVKSASQKLDKIGELTAQEAKEATEAAGELSKSGSDTVRAIYSQAREKLAKALNQAQEGARAQLNQQYSRALDAQSLRDAILQRAKQTGKALGTGALGYLGFKGAKNLFQ